MKDNIRNEDISILMNNPNNLKFEMNSAEHFFSNSYSDSHDSHDSDQRKQKRNRISFVCQSCRKSKTKCDREKPECGRCIKLGIKCIYDVSKQIPPRIPSKDATIARLQKDVHYWKNKAMKLINEQHDNNNQRVVLSEDEEYLINNPKRSLSIESSDSIESPQNKKRHALKDIQINLYKDHSTMIFSKVMKQDVKPLSENFVLIQDKFISTLIASVFIHPSRNSMIPALTANANISRAQPSIRNNVVKLKEMLMDKYKDPFQREKINEFTDRILQNATTSRNLKIGVILSMLYNTVGHEYLEDHCFKPGEYSVLLQTFITEFENILPPKNIVDRYKANFYEYVHPNLPFLDIDMFEETISQTVLQDPQDENKIKINLGNTHLRFKLENLSILLVLLKLSYISFCATDVESTTFPSEYLSEKVVSKYPISNDVILLAQRCLASENWCACTNENIITCLLYIWSFFAFSPEEGDFFLEHPTDVISSLIMMLSTSIGLHRDPYDFPQLKDQTLSDKRILNQRRLLWISVVGVCSFESTLKGRHPILSMDLVSSFMDIRSPEFSKEYMERVKNDLDYDFLRKSCDNDENLLNVKVDKILSIHKFTLIRAQFSILLADLDNLTLSYNHSFSLNCIELSRDRIENFIEEHLPLINFKEIDLCKQDDEIEAQTNSDSPDGPREKAEMKTLYTERLNFCSVKNSNALQTRMMNMLMMLRTTEAIFLHFELKVVEDKEKYFPYYYEYLVKTCTDALELIKVFNDFFTGKYKNNLLPSSYYNVRKVLQLALPTTIFSTLGMILRINLTCNKLYTECQEMSKDTVACKSDYFKELNRKLEIVSIFQKELEMAIEYIHFFSSEHLRFRYFSVFKVFALFDVIIQRMKKGELWLGILKLTNTDNLHSKIVKTLRMTLGIELNKKEELIEELERRNHIAELSLADLTSLCKSVKEIYETIPKPQGQFEKEALDGEAKQENTSSPIKNNQTTLDFNPLNSKATRDTIQTPYFPTISSLDNLQKLSSAANISNSLNIDPRVFNSQNGNDNPLVNNNAIKLPDEIRSSKTQLSKDTDGVGQKDRITSQFAGGRAAAGMNYEFPNFLGGLDLFDYDFLFGSDFS